MALSPKIPREKLSGRNESLHRGDVDESMMNPYLIKRKDLT
jgi:hypothetical protein